MIRSFSGWARWGVGVTTSVADQALVAGSQFVLQVITARTVSESSYGAFALAFAVLLFVTGAHTALVTEPVSVLGPARHAAELPQYLRSSFWLQGRLAWASAAAGAVGCAIALPFDRGLGLALLALVAAAPAYLWYLFLRRACYVLQQPRWALSGGAVYATVLVASILALQRLGRLSPVTGLVALAAAGAVGSLTLLLVSHLHEATPRSSGIELWKEAFPYGRWMLAANLAHWAGSGGFLFFVGILVGLAGAGAFRALQNLITPAQQVLAAVGMLLLPWVAAGRTGVTATKRRRVAWATGGLVVPYGAVLWLLGSWLMQILYGRGRFLDATPLLPFLVVYLLLAGAAHGLSISLRAEERSRAIFLAKLAAGAVALTLGLVLTAWAGLAGAVWGFTIGMATEVACLTWLVLPRGRR